jgi:hypothetical protein
MEPVITRMYASGPLRRFSSEKFLGGLPYCDAERKGFVASGFICELCQQEAREVVMAGQQWICRTCQTSGQRNRDQRSSAMKATRTVR